MTDKALMPRRLQTMPGVGSITALDHKLANQLTPEVTGKPDANRRFPFHCMLGCGSGEGSIGHAAKPEEGRVTGQ